MQFSTVKPWHIYLLSFIGLLILSVYSVGYYHPDEHFQIMEFAALKLHLTRPENLPWEFPAKMRPAVQPAIVVAVHHFFGLFGCNNPFTITFFLRILSSVVSFAAMWMIYRCYADKIKEHVLQKWFLMLSFLLWFALYNNVRFSSETWSGSLFIIGFSYLFRLEGSARKTDFFMAGTLLGLSFIFRYQSGFLVAGFTAWYAFIRKERFIHLMNLVTGVFIAFVVGIMIDRWFYGEWVLSSWNYFQQNILADKVSGFGLNPWYFYFEDVLIRAVPPFSLVYIIACLMLLAYRPKNILTWTIFPFILIHCLIGHKETRFLYPLVGFLPMIVILSIEKIKEKWNNEILDNRLFLGFAKAFWIVNIGFIILTFFNPADSQVNIYKEIYNRYNYPVTLYYLKDDPYARALDIYYYKRSGLTIKKASSVDQLNGITDTKFLVAVKNGEKDVEGIKNKRLIGSSFPEWIKMFDFNNWVERTMFWNVYEVEPNLEQKN